jgi:aryl-alcohol dehydrogenase-like predicted oxidoreductase
VEKLNRRKFIGTAIGLAGMAGGLGCGTSGSTEAAAPLGPPPGAPPPPLKATDSVKLGKSGLSVSLVGVGTGSSGWGRASNQTRAGQDRFTNMMRRALDNGVTLFDLADQYGSHPFFKRAMEGVPRDRYVIQTKTTSRTPEAARADIDRFLVELGTDHIDSLIIHCVTEADWSRRFRGVMDVFEEAKAKGKIRAHGVTCHSFPALVAAEASDWVQINQVRWNPGRSHMDADVEQARALFHKMRAKGQGMIGMKVVGQGDLMGKMTPEQCFRFQIESGVVDAFVVGVENLDQVDELLSGTQRALDSLRV